MTLSPADISRLVHRHGLHPSRALGQNFVADPNTVRRIARLAGVGSRSRVLEIGAGLGSLTVALAATGAEVVAVEVDRHLVPALQSVVAPYPSVRVVQADALTLDWDELLGPGPDRGRAGDPDRAGAGETDAEGAGEPDRAGAGETDAEGPGAPDDRGDGWQLVANLPYNVATPLVVRVLEEAPQVRSMLVMVQREVGERLAAAPGEKAYGAVTVKVSYWATSAVVGLVPPTVFIPKPSVDSALVRIDRRPEPAVPASTVGYDRLMAVVGAGFSQRRKMLRRSLAGVVTPAAFAVAGVAPQARAEELDVHQWGRLAGWRQTAT